MLKPTDDQREQISFFIEIMRDHLDSVILHPIVDLKTGVERLGICVADREEKVIHLLGLWFLSGDSLYDRFEFKDILQNEVLTERPASPWKIFLMKVKNRVLLLWK